MENLYARQKVSFTVYQGTSESETMDCGELNERKMLANIPLDLGIHPLSGAFLRLKITSVDLDATPPIHPYNLLIWTVIIHGVVF